jgi:hypothetical protein
MIQQISELTTDQAQRALLLFYSMLSDNFWDGEARPTDMDIEDLAIDLQNNAPEEVQVLLTKILLDDDKGGKAEISKIILQSFYQQEPLNRYVEDAVIRATEPQMCPIPLIIGATIVVLAAIPTEIHRDEKSGQWDVKFRNLETISDSVTKLTEFVKALPPGLLLKLCS